MNFHTLKKVIPQERWDDRQSRIDGWNADAIRQCTVLVVGAGATGNEVLKNLALLGFGHVIIADLDRIELSNLTRTVLFSKADQGREKAAVAKERFLDMNLEPTATADHFTGDIVYELGDGVFRRADVVLGCSDNVETRMYINRICMRYNIPYVDSGILSLGFAVQVMNGHASGCYCCHAPDYKFGDRFRQSCDVTRRKAEAAGKAPTVQCTSAMAAGMQVQEALKIICGMKVEYGREIHFQGTTNTFTSFRIPIDPNCMCHMLDPWEDVQQTPLSSRNTLREFLRYAGEKGCTVLDLGADKLRNFVTYARCMGCGKPLKIYRPLNQVYSEDFLCQECRENGAEENYSNRMDDISLLEFSLETTPEDILDLSLEQLGIPPLHVLQVRDEEGRTVQLELTEDLPRVLPGYAEKHGRAES